MTRHDDALQEAINFIKNQFYHDGSTTIKSIKASQAGCCAFGVWISIGGWHNDKRYSTDFITVEYTNTEEFFVFKLEKIYELATQTQQQSLF